ncbi:MAG: tetratricopeptide repeat protein, partial [Actinobacteria bacterium]|nr:tetratricopeptide repeat protein [Actinomycetota bacterium]
MAGVAETTLDLLRAEEIAVDAISVVGRQLDPERRRARVTGRVWEARGFLEVGNWNEAVRVLLEAYRLDPQNLTVMIDLGQLAMETPGQAANGRELIERAVSLYPENADSVHAYIHAIWEEDREAAEGLLQAILPARPQDADLLYDLACLRSLAGDDAKSEEYLRSAIDAGFRDWPHMEADADLRTLR